MPHILAIGDRAYSSWSLRGWLLCDAFGIAVETRSARLYSDDLGRVLADCAPARTVPTLRLADGTVVWDSLAIAETLHDLYPRPGSGPPIRPSGPWRGRWRPRCTAVSPRCAATAR